MNRITRRAFVGGSSAAIGFLLASSGSTEPFRAAGTTTPAGGGYGPLKDAGPLLALPEGFSYTVIGESGKATAAGMVHPGEPDAMGCFPRPDGGSTVVCNHELDAKKRHFVPHAAGLVYDEGAVGGTTTIEIGPDNTARHQYVSLAGTIKNCAGGVTPWGTWLTCEETEARAGARLTKDHGFVFEVDPASQSANIARSPIPLTFLGRFPHEAAALDPANGTIYLTEDADSPNGLYYRWTPPADFAPGPGALHALAAHGSNIGTLAAMACHADGRHITDLSDATTIGTSYDVTWLPVPDRLAQRTSVRSQFTDQSITRSRKLEGQWWGDGGVYVVASYARILDGSIHEHDGQVWFYDPVRSRITLKTRFGVNPDPHGSNDTPDGPDNITVSPHGGLILAEDGIGRSHLIGVTPEGQAYPLALNRHNQSEFCGPVFNAAGSTLFCNIQHEPGYTVAITGPWRNVSHR